MRAPTVAVIPANEASWDDLEAVLGGRGYRTTGCWCQRFKIRGRDWDAEAVPAAERAQRLREQTQCGNPRANRTSGLVAYLGGEPVGWCAVEPRTAYVRLGTTPWKDRAEDKTDDSIWAVTCFAIRAGFRRQGISYALARGAVDFARQRGAAALEGYSMIPQPGKDVPFGELHVGSRSIFAAAGFAEVTRPTLRRAVMRIDF
jgi:GNAT superfamily N-acetyltransferase